MDLHAFRPNSSRARFNPLPLALLEGVLQPRGGNRHTHGVKTAGRESGAEYSQPWRDRDGRSLLWPAGAPPSKLRVGKKNAGYRMDINPPVHICTFFIQPVKQRFEGHCHFYDLASLPSPPPPKTPVQ
jgi:hypothetical protein